MSQFPLWGEGPIREFLASSPQKIRSVRGTNAAIAPLKKDLERAGIAHKILDEKTLSGLYKEEAKQKGGIVAEIELNAISEEDFFAALMQKDIPLIVACDHITDPRNLGAIVRSAAYFGIPFVLAPKDRGVLLTPASVATSAGGFAYTELVVVGNLSSCLLRLKKAEYWILGADMAGENAKSLSGFYKKSCLVLGSEGNGLAAKIEEKCDRMVCIEKRGHGESLNVSVAAALLMYELSNHPHPT